ncbi:MAG TPA: type II CAAX endopeptidase family protein [Bacilli bacterium]|nr:type II CAAX endopeptidase family protein [Bacilli bacterium]
MTTNDKFIKLKATLAIFMYIFYESITNYIVKLLHIDIDALSKSMKVVYVASGEVLCLLFIIFLYRKQIVNGLKEIKKKLEEYAFFGGKVWLIGAFAMSVSTYIIGGILNKPISDNETAVRTLIQMYPAYMLFSTFIFAPIVEELVARKAIRDLIKNDKIFLIVSGLSFGVLHVVFTAKVPLDLLYAIPYSAMGVAFAYMLLKKKNIALPITVHMLHNAALVLVQIIGGLV